MTTTADPKANKIVVWMQSSLDGRTQGPHGEFDWPVVGPEAHTHFVETLRHAGLFGYGRKVFEMMAAYWPTAEDDPASTPMQAEYSRIWKPMPKLVFSRNLEGADWNTVVIHDIDPATVRERVSRASGNLYVFGGSEVVSAMIEEDLVDEFQIFVHPVILGGGPRLLPALEERRSMRLIENRTFDGSVLGLRYARA
jgi:dihydrofolate reductase